MVQAPGSLDSVGMDLQEGERMKRMKRMISSAPSLFPLCFFFFHFKREEPLSSDG